MFMVSHVQKLNPCSPHASISHGSIGGEISSSAVETMMLAVRFNRVDAPQSVSLKLKSPASSMRSGFLYCGIHGTRI